jgi:hypothetical protein
MRRFALAVVVALLAAGVSGMTSLLTPEPCSTSLLSGTDDERCPPTCATCGCCAQPAETVMLVARPSSDALVADIAAAFPRFPQTDPRAILHVPKSRIS